MPESAEHQFLKTEFLNVLENFSALKLYGFTESDRRKFDLSCLIDRDFARPLVGQTLWKHKRGIEKDLRTLITDKESEIKVYLAKDSTSYHSIFEEIIGDYKQTEFGKGLFKIKPIWIPSDFDADKIKHQQVVKSIVKNQIVDDILFNIVFGNLTSENISFFLDVSGIPGLNLIILYHVATVGFVNYPDLSKKLGGVSPGPLREKILVLCGAGFLQRPTPGASLYHVSAKGRLFLDLVKRIYSEFQSSDISEELAYILMKLDVVPIVNKSELDSCNEIFPKNKFISLLKTIISAKKQWDLNFDNMKFKNNYETGESTLV